MTLIEILLKAEAAQAGRAVRRTTWRHRHLQATPFVVTAFNLSGEAAAPLGICFGAHPDQPNIAVSPEPRNRESRFDVLNQFARSLKDYIDPFLATEWIESRGGRRFEAASDAPQIVTPNRATRDYIGARIGRSLRYLRPDSTPTVPESTIWTGAHLSFLADHAMHPGQSMFIAGTELLGQLFATGQSPIEDENLASLLAWILESNAADRSRIEAAEEKAYGPVADPSWERTIEPHVRAWSLAYRSNDHRGIERARNEVAGVVTPKLLEAWSATWTAVEVARSVPEAPHTAQRWKEIDLAEWSHHARRSKHGIPRFARRHGVILASEKLEKWSRALERVDFEEAIDDPMILAEHDAAGRCITGTVVAVDADNQEVKAGNKRRTVVPLVRVRLSNRPNLVTGDSVLWSKQTKIEGVVRSIDADETLLAILKGSNHGRDLPNRGDNVCFVAMSRFGGRSPERPAEVPWTHQTPPEQSGDDGSPDMTIDELVALPVVGDVSPDETPGVVV